ncbi:MULTISPECIES: chorismate-binding protein [Burkholderiaceae]|uniref:Para-aminobenzoate synthase, aminase component / Aminodeoxychorismate lyase n=1 Tax=Caballeronia sordidicola TaxID=196367 RepID=A0A242M472_CABSO|nr:MULTISPECIES: bifunctional anthranilate synthase component I family protein/class IV aminotransferase [Burkholderiaceae]AME23864.1 anthranilate synthase [Burkholderia sp. PAMC 26561]OTP65983.1 Para-aminobenzoate synthase, aminase component / Aminodeoxychorismate lyase [Caballeronia sordidicola]
MQQRGEVFALLDDCDSTAGRRSSRLYAGFVRERSCHEAAELDDVCASVRRDLHDGLHVVVLADYEFGRNLQLAQPGNAALRFLLFRECRFLSREEADQWLAENDNGLADQPSVAGVANIESSVTPDAFEHAIAGVQEALQAGDSYQINYTFRLAFDVFGSAIGLYRRLRERQPVRYGALIAMPDGRDVLSCSPELFIEREGDLLRARPMKGTAPRSADPEWLRDDPKNRAENVMIVDMLRNDMARVAVTGSVRVPQLFTVEAYKSVWQMTSTVEARSRPRTSFADILRALLPCGSITGAPKHKTMQLIDALESTPRGIYTGAIGWLDARDDFCLSVPIRTIEIEHGRGRMGIGAGIVLDSVAADEFEECQLKAQFLTGSDPGFQLFETTFATKDGIRHWGRHLARLASSARWCGFPLDRTALQSLVDETCAGFEQDASYRLRIALAKSGEISVMSALLAPLAEQTVSVLLASEYGFAPRSSNDPLLEHKTTSREDYDRAWREAETHGAFDMLFFNERGELTEGGRSNVFLKRDGRWKTPPLGAGLLPGVMRGVLLEELEAEQRALTLEDLNRAEALMICNALRGAVAARLKRKS